MSRTPGLALCSTYDPNGCTNTNKEKAGAFAELLLCVSCRVGHCPVLRGPGAAHFQLGQGGNVAHLESWGVPPSIKWGASQTGLSNSSSNKNYIPTQPLEGALAFMQQGSGKVRWLARAHIPPEARACLLPTCQASSAFCTVRAGKGRPRMHLTLLMPAATATPPPLSALREGDRDTENRDPQPGMMSPLMRDRGRVESAPDLSLLPKYLLNSPLNTSNSAECEQL